MSPKTIHTANTSREELGARSILNPHHEGTTKRPTETRAERRLDEITAEDINAKKEGHESPMNNPYFGRH